MPDGPPRRELPITFWAGRDLKPRLLERAHGGPLGAVAKRDVQRYYQLLEDQLAELGLSEVAMALVVDACSRADLSIQGAGLIWAMVDDAIAARGLDERYGLDRGALVRQLRELSPPQTLALADYVERRRGTT